MKRFLLCAEGETKRFLLCAKGETKRFLLCSEGVTKRFLLRRTALLLACALLFVFTAGCAYDPTVDQYFYMNISAEPTTLDPQTAEDSGAYTVIGNCFEGLLRVDSSGDLLPAAAEKYEVSPDGLTYTFHLREDALWRTSAKSEEVLPVTADDFVFAFQRLFTPETSAPLADGFLCIRGAKKALSGEADPASIGVYAADTHTVVFELVSPDLNFVSLLTTAAAMPCCRAFFESTGGRYGLESDAILCNGPFYISQWDHDNRIVTRRSLTYHNAAQILPAGVSYYIDDPDNWVYTFRTGETDCVIADGYDADSLRSDGYQTLQIRNKTWVLIFNRESEYFRSRDLRLALARSLDRSAMRQVLPSCMEDARAIVPKAVDLAGGNYRKLAGEDLALSFSLTEAKNSLRRATLLLETEKLPAFTMLVPETGQHGLLASSFQSVWKDELLAFVNIETVSLASIYARIESGNWEIALVPLTAQFNDPSSVLQNQLISDDSDLYTAGISPYHELLNNATSTDDRDAALDNYRQAESYLINEAYVIPLYYETTVAALGREVSGIEISPFGGQFSFASARKK